jgi:6-phosphogluconolactonase
VDPKRQQGPHAHSVTLDAANRFAFVADLGLDKIMVYEFDGESGRLIPASRPFAGVEGGAGPRHFAFHPLETHAYGIMEMGCSIVCFAYDRENGTLIEEQAVSTLPEDFEGDSTCADIHVHPSGRFVYGSNRGHDSLAIYSIASGSGRLASVGWESTRGKKPRNFALDPEGRFLLAANMESDSIVVFRIDPETGKLDATGCRVEVPAPVCLKLAPVG